MGTPGPHVPTRLGRYELLARLATGGMGEIFLARLEGAQGFEKLYVVKRILPHLADDAHFRQMLVEEARVTAKMAHANICQVYELGDQAGQLYIVMEYLEGVTLLPMLRKVSKEQQPLDFGFIGAVISQICDGLHYAHELRERNGDDLGVVHRDVTPSNVFLTESGVAKVLDFGIAKVKDAAVSTQTGTVKGKYAYMAPEQLRGGAVDRRADIFALGILLYEMTALRRLFQRKTDYLTFRAVMEQPLPDVRRYRPDIPAGIADVITRALDREPEQRFASARAFREAVLDGLGPKRPWGQSELGEFVLGHFNAELGRRSQQVQVAIHRPDAATVVGGRPTMPLIEQDEVAVVDDDDDGFPSVEETMDEMPAAIRIEQRRADTSPSAFVEHTPPPFAIESSTSGVSLEALTPNATNATPARRSLMWPMVAGAMVLVAGGALVLVWRQQGQPQTPIVIQQYSTTSGDEPTPGSATVDPPGSGSGSGSTITAPIKHPPMSGEAYTRAINGAVDKLKPRLVDCVARYGLPPVGTIVSLIVTTEGRARSVTFKPADPDKSFASCVQQVMSTASYPRPPTEWVQDVTLRSH